MLSGIWYNSNMLKLIIALISNIAAILAAEYFVTGFQVTHDPVGFAIVAVLFMLANGLLLPMLRFILKPIILITFGLFSLVLNGATIYLVDFFSTNLTISGLMPLLYATIIIGMVNATFAYGAKAFKQS